MIERRPPAARWRAGLGVAAATLLLAACQSTTSPSPRATVASAAPTQASATPRATATAAPTAAPTATPEPALSLDLPGERDARIVEVTVSPEVPPDGDGQIVVEVANLSDTRVLELVLRWPTDLKETLFLAPFAATPGRIAEGGPPLLQDWTKWVEGPGESGEPAGTTSLGWGPLDPGATLTIPIVVTRVAAGPVSFDLQVLADEAILTMPDEAPAELRVEVP